MAVAPRRDRAAAQKLPDVITPVSGV